MMIMMKVAMIILLLLTAFASAHPEEAVGVVTRITDGTTFEVSDLGCVRLADVASVAPNSQIGLDAREFTRDSLMGTQVFLDIDNKTGQDKGGCWMCVVYKARANGTIDLAKNFNKMYVDARYGMARDDLQTEFDPMDW
jgi:endonuclease YncB( thermonuclease family)